MPEVLAAEVLPQMKPTGIAMFARVWPASRAVVVASGLPHAGTNGGLSLKSRVLLGSVELRDWAKTNDCRWDARACATIAGHWHLQVLRRARELECPWDAWTCAAPLRAGTWRC